VRDLIIYNKAVRDLIPDIITQSGKACRVETLSPEEYHTKLTEKLSEELQEYLASNDVTELADLVEVVYGILEMKGITITEFEQLRLAKKQERGGFSKRVFLVSVEE
jgi:predicted house-cleaning noncanonical NTP pyrophosphatase (MazG superfamily)